MYMRLRKKFGEFNKFLRFRVLFCTIFGVMVFNNIREVRWHVVSVVLFQNFCEETAYLLYVS